MQVFEILFFIVGILAVITLCIPTVLQVVIFVINTCRSFKTMLVDDLEVKKASLKARKQAKLNKIPKVEENVATKVEEIAVEVETPVVEETTVEETPVVNVEATVEATTTVVEETK